MPANKTPGPAEDVKGLLPLPLPPPPVLLLLLPLPLPLLPLLSLLLRADSGEREGRGILLLCTEDDEEAPA